MGKSRKNEVDEEHERAVLAMERIPHKILVMSGKGGVGKTTFSVNLAYTLASMEFNVGILDADLHGPNVALMTGIEGISAMSDGELIMPVVAARRVKVLSIASFLPDAGSPVIWRGPRKAAALRQFVGQTDWRGLDVLVVDCPPGTGDEPMSVAQLIPSADGVVVVTSPQEVSLLDCRKCIAFVSTLGQRVIGIVENFSGFTCPECQHWVDLMKTGGGERAASELGIRFLGRVPITKAMVDSGDSGRPLVQAAPKDPAAVALRKIVASIAQGWRAGERPVEPADAVATPVDVQEGKRVIAVAAEDDAGMDGRISAHFGRCPYYLLADVQGDRVVGSRIQVNPHYGDHRPGQMPEYIHSLGADVILAGGMGPKAVQMFHGYGIEVATGATGNVGQAIAAYLHGDLSGIVPCAHDHADSCGGHGPM